MTAKKIRAKPCHPDDQWAEDVVRRRFKMNVTRPDTTWDEIPLCRQVVSDLRKASRERRTEGGGPR